MLPKVAFLGHTTNNVAEYRALLLGLEGALEAVSGASRCAPIRSS